jgi:Transglutaminase-like superfamily
MKKSLWFPLLAVFLFVCILIANIYVFFTREWESSFAPSSYATLYYPLDVPTIRSWKLVERDRLQLNLACAQPIAEWKIFTDGANPQTSLGTLPAFHIDTTFSELHVYRIVPVPENACPAIEIGIRFYSREFYASLGMKHVDVYIVRSNVPCGIFEQFSVADWVDDYSYVGEEGLAAARRILKEEVGITSGDPTFAKMEKLVPYLRKKLKGSGGVPKDDERWINPWVLYNEMINGTGKGWCTQNAQVYVFWANQAGIPTRFVFNARTQDNTIVYTGHAFAESFIREQSRWAYVDLSQGQIYVTNKQGEVLNTAELFQLNQHNAFDSTLARIYVGEAWAGLPGVARTDTVISVPFALCNSAVRTEFTAHSIFKYRRPPNVEDVREIYTGFFRDRTFLVGNLERYFFKPQLAYSFYPTEGGQTYLLRRVLLAGLLASVLLCIGALRRSKRQ